MAGLAQILKESGHDVSGSDTQYYPPMSDYLKKIGIETIQGYQKDLMPKSDLYVIGNALSRGNESVEEILDKKLPFVSGPEMLGKELKNRNVFAVSGTHGKTTTAYMLAHILREQGKDIGFLIGGISQNFDNSANLGTHKSFVIEADEYDSAFFDKRSKFIHYSPMNLIINNIEFDHADIFDDINSIKKQFHNLLKIIPSSGNIIYFEDDVNCNDLIKSGLWCQKTPINSDKIKTDFNMMEFTVDKQKFSLKELPLIGEHNFKNYVSAILAARFDGVSIDDSIKSLKTFKGVLRRLELVAETTKIKVYDDFAHHPTAIDFSTRAIRRKYPDKKILGIVELGSNTMSSGHHKEYLINSFSSLDETILLDHKKVYKYDQTHHEIETLLLNLKERISDYDIILVMTNKDSQKFIKPILEYIEK
jgi:UDP-N-acetylmuramate: L-alanyl-gamma-D-glutamyl-meso-diaminopimelate ligase